MKMAIGDSLKEEIKYQRGWGKEVGQEAPSYPFSEALWNLAGWTLCLQASAERQSPHMDVGISRS